MTDTKTGAELEPERGSKGTAFTRRLFGAIGIGLGDRSGRSSDSSEPSDSSES